jgi:excisionase family DNA binding protein
VKTYSTVQVAKLLGIGYDTLHRWIQEKKVAAPKPQSLGGVRIRLWTDADVAMVKKYKAEHYWGRGSRRK